MTQTGTPATGASGRHQDGGQLTSDRGGKTSTSNQGGKTSTSNQGGKTSTLNQGGKTSISGQGRKTSTPSQGGKLASAGRGGKQATSWGPVDPPPEWEGVGDGAWNDWYQQTLWGAEGGMSEPQGPPYPIGTAQVRREAIGQIYNCVDGKDLPPRNIAFEAPQAYYSGVDPQTLKTWACQILCMISEYHMACMTRGSLVTSPILPGIIKERLPPLTDYTLPEDGSGVTDVRVWDHQARTLWEAVWLHRLDMALSEESTASGSLVRARHSPRCLLAYFLAPGTAWSLQFEDVIDQVLRENKRHNERKCNESTSSLQKCRNRRTKLREEFDAVSKAMEVLTDAPSRRKMEQRLNTLQTPLNVVERSITKFENLIEDCQMLEEEVCHVEEDEAHLEEEIHQEEEEEIADIEMVKEEEHGDLESSGPRGEAKTRASFHWSLLEMPSPQRRMLSSYSQHPNLKIQQLDLTAPGVRPAWSQEGWPSCALLPRATLGTRRMRPHHRSLPFSPPEVLHLSPLLPWKREVRREVGWEKTGTNSSGRVRDGVTSSCYLSCVINQTNHIIMIGGV